MEQNYYIKNIFSKFIEISGEDRANFLQGIITNDINKCENKNTPIYSCFLSPQGKFLADFFIVNFDNYYLIEIDKKFFELFYSKLILYKLRSKVEFKEIKSLLSFIFFTKNIPDFDKNIITFNDPRNKNLGIKVYLNNESSNLKILSKIKKYEFINYEKILMKNLVPNSNKDLIENKSLLLENNFDNINAIDWNKGCYVGQEITARMKYRSLLKKKLYILQILSGNLNLNDDLIEHNVNIGKVISKIDNYILCMLKINLAESKRINKDQIKISSSTIIKFL